MGLGVEETARLTELTGFREAGEERRLWAEKDLASGGQARFQMQCVHILQGGQAPCLQWALKGCCGSFFFFRNPRVPTVSQSEV